MNSSVEHGVVNLRSEHSFAITLQRLESLLRDKGIQTFCRVDHSGEAAKAGLTIRPTMLLIFGSPKAGTPLMIESPTLALDLPLKALIWEDAEGVVWVTYNSSAYLRSRHNLKSDAAALAAVEQLLAVVANDKNFHP